MDPFFQMNPLNASCHEHWVTLTCLHEYSRFSNIIIRLNYVGLEQNINGHRKQDNDQTNAVWHQQELSANFELLR